jgi:hypothetical protein
MTIGCRLAWLGLGIAGFRLGSAIVLKLVYGA